MSNTSTRFKQVTVDTRGSERRVIGTSVGRIEEAAARKERIKGRVEYIRKQRKLHEQRVKPPERRGSVFQRIRQAVRRVCGNRGK